MTPEEKLTVEEFAQVIRNKYNDYNDVEDSVLVNKILEKYPYYSERVETPIIKDIEKTEVVAEDAVSVETSAAEDTELVSEDISLDEQPEVEVFTPNTEGEAYYERLKARDGMMNAEVAAYENWKTENKSKIKEVEDVKVNPVTNQPLVDVSEGVDISYGLEVSEDNQLFDKEISESFVYNPENKEISELIQKSDSINKDKNIDPNSIEYYYGDRFTKENSILR